MAFNSKLFLIIFNFLILLVYDRSLTRMFVCIPIILSLGDSRKEKGWVYPIILFYMLLKIP